MDFLLHLIREAYPFRDDLQKMVKIVVEYLKIVVENEQVQIKDYQKELAQDIIEWIGPESRNDFMKAMGIANKEILVRIANEYLEKKDRSKALIFIKKCEISD